MISVREISVYIYVIVMSFFSFFLYSFQKYIFIFSFLVFFLFSSTIFLYFFIYFIFFFLLFVYTLICYVYILFIELYESFIWSVCSSYEIICFSLQYGRIHVEKICVFLWEGRGVLAFRTIKLFVSFMTKLFTCCQYGHVFPSCWIIFSRENNFIYFVH